GVCVITYTGRPFLSECVLSLILGGHSYRSVCYHLYWEAIPIGVCVITYTGSPFLSECVLSLILGGHSYRSVCYHLYWEAIIICSYLTNGGKEKHMSCDLLR